MQSELSYICYFIIYWWKLLNLLLIQNLSWVTSSVNENDSLAYSQQSEPALPPRLRSTSLASYSPRGRQTWMLTLLQVKTCYNACFLIPFSSTAEEEEDFFPMDMLALASVFFAWYYACFMYAINSIATGILFWSELAGKPESVFNQFMKLTLAYSLV